jgi:hypothetical protein
MNCWYKAIMSLAIEASWSGSEMTEKGGTCKKRHWTILVVDVVVELVVGIDDDTGMPLLLDESWWSLLVSLLQHGTAVAGAADSSSWSMLLLDDEIWLDDDIDEDDDEQHWNLSNE